ncbi:MAG TPA: GspE/PulE family protein [Sedimentisphaerales bacterium]|nr:GspE/PulE family protein [Sedimentisphaerales bacterium]HNU31434.1 GspE/PulE family protein [Sedimentisphaerales bacterium]
MNDGDPIIAFLVKEKAVSSAEIEALAEKCKQTGESLLTLLKREKLLDEEQLARAVASVHQFEFVNLSPEMIDPIIAHLISHEVANRYGAIPLKREGQQLVVAMSAPLDLRARDEIELKTGYRVVPAAATPHAVQQAIHYHFDVANVTKQAIASMRLKGDPGQDAGAAHQEPEGPLGTGDDPITKLVASIIRGAIDARSSDIHIEPQTNELRVRYRVDGMLRRAVDVPLSAQAEVISHIKILAQMDISEKRIPQDGHITLRHEGQEYDLRVSSLPSVGGEKIVLRILDKNASRWSLDQVVTSPDDNRKFRELTANPYGMLLLTGPTGSGKTTTLYSVLQLVNTLQRNIVTVEDPVEYRLGGITQVQIKPAAGLTFASALRSILRQDPDIILIGEIRDLETAEIAISAALTGHLVLSTLHTNDAAGAVSRLVNIGIPPFLVASALLGAVAQRLVRVICPRCRQACDPEPHELDLLRGRIEPGTMTSLSRGQGCPYCYRTGYKGRKAIYEIMPVSHEIRRMILDGAGDSLLKEQAIKEGMKTLRTNALEEVVRGSTTIEELTRVVDLKSD